MFNKYILVGATDRINYGDNLFPILVEKFLRESAEDSVEVKNYAVLNSNLESYGALPTLSMRNLYEDPFSKDSRIIVVGGEVLGGDWAGIYKYCNPIFHTVYNNRIGKKIISNEWVRMYLGGRGTYPFIPTPDMFKYDVSIAYNAVGGARNAKAAESIAPLLMQSAYASFRDNDTLTSLKAAGLRGGVLTPDSALLMSKVFSAEYINDRSSKVVKDFLTGKSYVYFQVGAFKGGRDYTTLTYQLINILEKTDLGLCLCPIGLAAGHDDHIALKKIYDILLKNKHANRVTFFPAPNIWDTMNLIKNSSCYLGTSLHGVITAQSFSVPYILINNKIKKGVEYIRSWSGLSLDNTVSSLDEFGELFLTLSLLEIKESIKSITEKQFKLAEENMRTILGLKNESSE